MLSESPLADPSPSQHRLPGACRWAQEACSAHTRRVDAGWSGRGRRGRGRGGAGVFVRLSISIVIREHYCRVREAVQGRFLSTFRCAAPRLLTTINKQESVMVDTRIFTIYQILILEYWRQLITR